ncbi:SDR family NAD(P)-dependent oxidoreductase [Salinarimonas rosea]|uniref:SDR family NAD(P)-dependent oxidoreductase n=1 Tax=Salinarimonas rosea TaxID=552063 RepID=UPI0003F589A3|nr:SDR family oxidoreductase [Salinarimonas rosea]
MAHPALEPGATAVVTGGAAGIGLAAARRFAEAGLNVVVADLGEERLARAAAVLAAAAPRGADAILARACDVSRLADLVALEAEVAARFGGTDVLVLNAGIQPGSRVDGPREAWERILAVNLWGVVNGAHAFVGGMRSRGGDGLVIATGSKQGITTPPGDPAYNVSKAGVKVFTEALAHDLRQDPECRITAHLLIPGFVFTELTARGRTEKPAGAWTPEETVDFMLERLEAGDFYILCPDNEVTRAVDGKRIRWAAGDVVENRPALSRWHPDWADAFAAYMRDG